MYVSPATLKVRRLSQHQKRRAPFLFETIVWLRGNFISTSLLL